MLTGDKNKKSRGFTLIELAVVLATFLFVIGAAIGIFIYIVQHQKKVLAEQQLLSQISYAEEHMSKALRMAKIETTEGCLVDTHGSATDNTGYIYLLTRYDQDLQAFKGIKFINQSDNNACQEFFLDNDDLENIVLKELKNSTNDSDAVPLTSTNMQIKSVKFSINGSNGSTFASASCPTDSQCGASIEDSVQPRVTILLNISIPGDRQEPTRTIQTTVSQRNIAALSDIGAPCTTGADCISGYCYNNICSAAEPGGCSSDYDCEPGYYCDLNTCVEIP